MTFEVHEASIADLRAALGDGRLTAVALLDAYLARIAAFDGALNAIVVANPEARADAEAADARRAAGRSRGPLDGIPYTAKDSYSARGLTVAAGSPAFADLVAQRDAFVIELLRAGGAVLIGLTNGREPRRSGRGGWCPRTSCGREIVDLSAYAWDDFLSANADPALNRLADVDGSRIFPPPPGALPDRYAGFEDDIADYPAFVRDHPIDSFLEIPDLADGVRGLERTRQVDLEEWMDGLRLDAVLFPAVAAVGPADMDVDPASADLGWRNGVWVANGNLVIRHLGIPTVTVPMGPMADIGMPVGLTFAGRAYDDVALLRYAAAFEATGSRRTAPPRTPPLSPR